MITRASPQTKIRQTETFVRTAAVVAFLVSAAFTVYESFAMSGGMGRGGMEMPGGWSMSMMWMAMPGQSTAGAAAMFLLMWQAMMIAMMLPSTWPMLELYWRVEKSTGAAQPALATFVLGAAYFGVWLAFGVGAFAIGFGISHAAMRSVEVSSSVPLAGGIALILSGAYQVSPWKQACLTHCRSPFSHLVEGWKSGWTGACRLGLKHGSYCALCCWALMLIQMVLGAMNLAVMALVAVVIGLEKLWKHGPRLARWTGFAAIAIGGFLALKSLI